MARHDAQTLVRDMLQASVVELEHGRARYLSSPLGKARFRISEIERLSRKLNAQAHDVGIALSRGTGALEFAEITAETVRDLRIAAADLETFVRVIDGPA